MPLQNKAAVRFVRLKTALLAPVLLPLSSSFFSLFCKQRTKQWDFDIRGEAGCDRAQHDEEGSRQRLQAGHALRTYAEPLVSGACALPAQRCWQ